LIAHWPKTVLDRVKRDREDWRMETDGWRFVGPMAGLTIIFLGLWWRTGSKILLTAGVVCGIAAIFTAYFFRDPERQPPEGLGWVVSPADGRISRIENDPDGRRRIAIFLSVFDVHVNRAPIAGTVASVNYRPGQFFKAFDPRASKENEQTVIVINSAFGPIEFSLIAGILARRIVCRIEPGQEVQIGQRVGLIRFGSRAEIVLPPEANILVQPGDRVKGCLTPVARFEQKDADA